MKFAFLLLAVASVSAVLAQSTPYRSYVVQLDDDLKRALLPEHALNCSTVFFTVERSRKSGVSAYLLYAHFSNRRRVLWWEDRIVVNETEIAFVNARNEPTLIVKRICTYE